MDVLDYEPKQPSTAFPRFVLVNLLLIALAAWPFIQPQIISPQGMSDNDLRFAKFEFAMGFAASYVLTRRKSKLIRSVGWILFAPHALIAAGFAFAVIRVAFGLDE